MISKNAMPVSFESNEMKNARNIHTSCNGELFLVKFNAKSDERTANNKQRISSALLILLTTSVWIGWAIKSKVHTNGKKNFLPPHNRDNRTKSNQPVIA